MSRGQKPMMQKKSTFSRGGVKDYEARRYRGLDQRWVHHREIRILENLLERMGDVTGWALDLPCGYGRFSGLLLDRDLRLLSTDYSFEMVRRAYEKTRGTQRAAGMAVNAKQRLPFQDDSFCLVLSMRFFHHVHDPGERLFILKEFARVSNRWVIVSFYLSNPLHRLQRHFRKKIRGRQTHIMMISREEMNSLGQKAGLHTVRAYPLLPGIHAQQIVLFSKTESWRQGQSFHRNHASPENPRSHP